MATGENLGAKFTLDISNLKAGLSEANKMIRQSESEFIQAAAGMNDWTKSADGLALRVNSLNKQIDIQKQKISALIAVKEQTIEKMQKEGASNEEIAAAVDKVNSQLAKEQKQLESLQSKADKAGKELDDFNASEGDAAEGSRELENATENAGKAAEKAGQGFTVFKGVLANLVSSALKAAAGALRDFAGSVIETGMAFDESMSKVAALSGATGEDLELLTETAREFGATTQFSANEAADALGYMALAGWDAKESAAALGGVLDLAAASGMGLAQASDMVTDYLSAFGMTAEQSAEFADLLAYAQANSNTSAEQLGEAYKNCAANLSAAGQDVQTVTSLLAAMANQGLKGSTAGTALAAIMRDITKKMDDGKISIGETTVAVMDAAGNFRDLTDILADVEKATEGMGDAEKSAALLSTFTSDSIKGLNLVLNDGVANAEDFENALRNSSGSAAEMAATLNDNLSGDLKALGSAFDEFKLTIFEGANNPLRELVQTVSGGVLPALTDMIAGVEGADVAFGEAIGELVNSAITNLTNMLPSILSIVTTIIPTVLNNLVAQLPTIISFIVSDLIPSVLSTLATLAPQILGAVLEIIPTVLNEISGQLPDIINMLTDLIFQLVNQLIAAAPMILQAAMNLFSQLLTALLDAIPKIIEQLPILIKNVCDMLISAMPQLLNAAIQLFQQIIAALPVILEALIAALPDIINTIINFILDSIPMLLNAAIQLLMSLINAIPTILIALVQQLPTIITTIITTLLSRLPDLIMGAIQLFMGIIKAIPQICIELVKNLPQIIVTIVEGLISGLGQIAQVGIDLIKGLWEGIKSVGKWLWDKISGFFSGIFDKIKGFFGIHSPSTVFANEIGKPMAQGIGVGFGAEMENVAAEMQTALDDAMPTAEAALKVSGTATAGGQNGTNAGGVIINQTNHYSQQHSRFEIYQSKQATAAAVRAALTGV